MLFNDFADEVKANWNATTEVLHWRRTKLSLVGSNLKTCCPQRKYFSGFFYSSFNSCEDAREASGLYVSLMSFFFLFFYKTGYTWFELRTRNDVDS